MSLDVERFASLFQQAYADARWPPPFAKSTGRPEVLRRAVIQSLELGIDESELARIRRVLGSLIIGQAAEKAFESIYGETMQTTEVRLEDDRAQRSDADFILRNGANRPLYRMNIKLHGSQFRKAKEQVGLDPADCFPLATYKIAAALEKQNVGHLPYLFIVVTVPGLRAEEIGSSLPEHVSAGVVLGKRLITSGKRDLEERFIAAHERTDPAFYAGVAERLRSGRWFIFSARRAEILMKDKLFERVFALRQPGFNRAFKNAEIDMHLSFSKDTTTLRDFLERSASLSSSQLYSMIERGTI
ncbi:MAG TPA: hypothetical protein VGS12_03650 [Caulobacteraceae bacterium]|nr:hypothetical protein [Caulobacteraceae bacterium]